MRILRLNDAGSVPVLVEGIAPQPQPGRGEILIRVHAAGVTPTERIWYPTTHTKDGGKRAGAVPGHEFSGVIAGLGEDLPDVQIGQEVFGMSDWFAEGAMAEYCLTVPSSVAPKPPRLSHAEAASVPIGALTAWQGLFDRAGLQAGETVLVHGGAGAVGLFAVQLGRSRGAHVIATASARNLDFVRQLGAQQVIDYRAERFEERARDVDVVFDTVGGETLERSWGVLKPGGRMVTVAASAEAAPSDQVKKAFFIVEPDRQQLTEVGEMLGTGLLKIFVAAVPFSQASAAFAGEVAHDRGKLVVRLIDH